MSTRALRKAQRELEEQRALQEAEEAHEESEAEDEQPPSKPTKQSLFALLNEQENEDEDEDGDGDDEEPEKENVKVVKDEPKAATPSTTNSSKKKKKKNKKKAKAAAKMEEKDDDNSDFDAELASAVANDKAKVGNSQASTQESQAINGSRLDKDCQLLSVNTQNLHVANEMRRLFGRDAVEAERRAPQPARRGGRRGQAEPGRGFPELSLRRNIFIQGKEDWPRATTGGLAMELVNKQDDGRMEYRFIHSAAYQAAQRDYETAVASMDHERMVMLLQQNPYHIATLLQVSEIMKHQGQHAEAGDMLERSLFSFGRAVHSTFSHSLSQGKARLDFRHPENREFFLSVWRYIQNISMRSTWRTVYEWAKLLLSLAPEEDPYAMKLVLDQYAVRAQQGQHYLDLLSGPGRRWKFEPLKHIHISWGLALAYLQASNKDEARAELGAAIHDTPHLAHRLLRELDISPVPPALWSYHEPSSPREALFTTLYITRAKDLWSTPEATALLTELCKEAKHVHNPVETERVSQSEARHIYLCENDALLRLLAICSIPALGPKPSPGPRPVWDPFPPHDNIESYNPYPARGMGGRGMQGVQALGNLSLSGEELEEIISDIVERQRGQVNWDHMIEGVPVEELMARMGIVNRQISPAMMAGIEFGGAEMPSIDDWTDDDEEEEEEEEEELDEEYTSADEEGGR